MLVTQGVRERAIYGTGTIILTLNESPCYITKVESLALKKVDNITLCVPLRELPYNSIIEQDCKLNAKLTEVWSGMEH